MPQFTEHTDVDIDIDVDEFLDECDKYHNDMITPKSDEQEKIYGELLTLDGNTDIYSNGNRLEEWINEIDKFIH